MKLRYQKYTLARGLEKIKTRTAIVLAAVSLIVGGGGGLSMALLGTTHAAAATTITPANFNTVFSKTDVRQESTYNFVTGPGTGQLGDGSLELNTVDSAGKQQHLETDQAGTKLADINALGYETYRHSTSTGSSVQVPSINMEISAAGDGSGYTTLIFEPVYNTDQATIQNDTWQTWDAYNGGNAIWWSSHAIPGVCASTCYVKWSDIVKANPNAVVLSYGINQGTGNQGIDANVDALTLGAAANTTTYDFEKVAPDTTAPDVAITNPTDGSTVAGTVDIRGTVTDASPNHYYLKITNDSTGAVVYSKTTNDDQSFTGQRLYSWDTTAVADGNYTILLAARDNAGNRSGNVTVNVTVNNTPDNQDQCKDGGWVTFTKPSFKNQGLCIAYTNHNNGVGQDDVHANKH